MRRIINHLFAAALMGPLCSAFAVAQEQGSFPRVVGSGENASVEYGPGPRGNIVGGGRVDVAGSGENIELRHLDPLTVQHGYAGLIPSSRSIGENSELVWLPAPHQGAAFATAAARLSR
ncbi:hypothetical protein [Falsiroseomonas sp. E2-1-a20]|uniref:hypothetical protein n=1 Tax=Falsiroseomonas sp. E2-1-a20 TaxID=3239300 RepID=UPI003F40BFC0